MTLDPKRVKEIFLEAAELTDEAARMAYLDKACGGDAGLRARVEALLLNHDPAGSFLGTPAAVVPDLDPAATQSLTGNPDPGGEAAQSATGENGTSDDESLSFLSPPTRPDALGRIGHYEVLQVLGRGGFGIVFRVFDEMLQRVVALKVMAPQLAATSPARKRFLREARSSAQVRHENVVQVYEVAEQPLPYLAMEFIPGETLQQKLNRVGPLDVPEVLRIGRQIAEGLAAAHATDLIHRDIKPGNVLLEGGQHKVKITDFGLARAADDASISQSGIIAGTPMYMAPEQAQGQTLDQRADLFSLGSVLYQMVAGRPPFRASSAVAVLKRVAEDKPRAIREIIPETPQWLCDIIAKLHAKDPDDRYQSAREVADVLADCEAQLKANARLKDYSRIPRSKQPAAAKSRWWKWAAAAAVLLAAVALTVTEFAGLTHLLRKPQSTVGGASDSGLNAEAETPPAVAPPVTDWAREIALCVGHKGPVRGAAFGPGGKFLTTAGADQSVRIWNSDNGKQLRSFEFRSSDVGAVTVAGNLLVAGGKDYAFMGWDTNTWQEIFAVTDHPGWSVRALALYGSGFLSCGPNDGGFHFFDLEGKFAGGWFTSDGSKPGSVIVRPDGRRIVVGLDSGAIDFWIDPQGQFDETKRKILTGHAGGVRALAYSPGGAVLASAGFDKSIALWNGEDGKKLGTLAGHDGTVLALAYSPDGKFLVSGGADRTIRLWDIAARKPVGALLPMPATVNALAWSADGYTLASACDDGSVKLWHIAPRPRNGASPLATVAPFTDADVQRIAALPAAKQVEEVRKELMRRNPGFDGKMEHKIEEGVVTEFKVVTDKVADIAPIRVFNALRVLDCRGSYDKNGLLADLTPLQGMSLADLTHLNLSDTKVTNAGMVYFKDCKNLRHLLLARTQVSDAGLSHFKDCKALTTLFLGSTQVSDAGLSHFKDCKNLTGLSLYWTNVSDAGLDHFQDCKDLTFLTLAGTKVSDAGMVCFKNCKDLTRLHVDHTQVGDAGLAYFKGMPLRVLWIDETAITDLTALQGMRLEDIRLTPKNITRGLDILRDMKSVKTIGISWEQSWPVAEFWERYDKGELK